MNLKVPDFSERCYVYVPDFANKLLLFHISLNFNTVYEYDLYSTFQMQKIERSK